MHEEYAHGCSAAVGESPHTRPLGYSGTAGQALHSPPVNTRHARLLLLLTALAAGGCATLDTLATGRTDRLGEPPFVLGFEPSPAPAEAVVLAPVALDRVTLETGVVPATAAALAPLAAAMDARLAAMDCCTLSAAPRGDDGAPWVYVGSAEGESAPPEAQQFIEEYDKFPPMVLHVEYGATTWQAELAAQPAATAYLWIRLALVDYPGADEGLFGKKVVLGERHEVKRPFLRAELQPIQVLQVTGALLSPDGRVIAAGAEGIHAVDTPFKAQMFGLQKEIHPGEIEAVIHELRRDDLPGRPLKWEAALDNLVYRLLHGH